MNFDRDQRQALGAVRNVVVAAGAGSGKTTVLAERYLRLVRDLRTPVSAILTLTFTRKAAAEMHERIHSRLRAIADDEFIARQLETFDRAPISTLDSFCAELVRSAAPQFGVTTDFRTDEEEYRRLADEAALEVLLEHLDREPVARFVAANDFTSVWHECLAKIAAEYLVITRPVDASAIAASQQAVLHDALNQSLADLEETVARIATLEAGGSGAASTVIEAAQGVDLAAYRDGAELRQLLAVVSDLRSIRKPGGRASGDIALLKDLMDEMRLLCENLQTLGATLLMQGDVRALLSMVQDYDRRLQTAKRAQGLLTYSDVMEMAIAALQQDHQLRQFYNRKYRFIMIDEFQDNNERQKLLLYLLALDPSVDLPADRASNPDPSWLVPDKLFFVGDDKQSIYRFRGADVSVFRTLAAELACGASPEPDAAPEPESYPEPDGDSPPAADPSRLIELSHNYRSQPQLIDFFNRLFPRVMADAEQPYEARFAPLQAGAEQRLEPTVQILVKPFQEDDDESDEDQLRNEDVEAYAVARWIERAVRERTLPIVDGEETRPAAFDDIALLLRSSGNQMRFERMFRRFGIPYQSQSVRSLFLEAPAYDLYQLLQLACYPSDRQAYAALLRSPLVHLDDDALVEILLRDEEPFAGCEPTAAEDPASESSLAAGSALDVLTDEQRSRYRAGSALYADIRSHIDRRPVSWLISRIWFDWGYRYTLLRRSGYHPYLEYYEHLFAFARSYDPLPVVDFLDAFRSNLGEYGLKQELEVVREGGRGVQIMTIHRSKGLEFPVVILANSGNVGRSEGTGSSTYHLSERYGLTFNLPTPLNTDKKRAVNWFFSQGKEEEKRRALAEAKRLLYVALTRAECHLLVSGYFHRNNRTNENAHLNMVLSALDVPIGDTGAVAAPPRPESAAGGTPRPAASHVVARPHPIVQVAVMPDVAQSELDRQWQHGVTVSGDLAAQRYRALPVVRRELPRREYRATELNALWAAAHRTEEGRELPALDSDPTIAERQLEAEFGTLCHSVIEQRLRLGRDLNATELERLAENVLPADIGVRATRQLVRDAAALASRFFSSPEYDRYVAPVPRRQIVVEHGFVMRPQQAPQLLVHGQIDLFVAHEQGGILIDFKTNRSVMDDEYAVQIALYREAAREIFGDPVRAFVCYLREPLWLDGSDGAVAYEASKTSIGVLLSKIAGTSHYEQYEPEHELQHGRQRARYTTPAQTE